MGCLACLINPPPFWPIIRQETHAVVFREEPCMSLVQGDTFLWPSSGFLPLSPGVQSCRVHTHQTSIHQTPSTRCSSTRPHQPDSTHQTPFYQTFIYQTSSHQIPIHQTPSTRLHPPDLVHRSCPPYPIKKTLSTRYCPPGFVHQAPLQQTLPTMPLPPPAPLFLSFVLNCLQSCASGYSWFSDQYQLSLPVHLLP